MSTSTLNTLNKFVFEQIIFERRILLACTALVGVCVIVWIVAISTDYWFLVHAALGGSPDGFINSNSGLWRLCRTQFKNSTNVTTNSTDDGDYTSRVCKFHDWFPSDQKLKVDPALDENILNYSRTEVSFAIISLFLMLMGSAFSIYTFRNPRYTFKRLAGGIHYITAGTVLVVIEVLISSIDYEMKNLQYTYPTNSSHSYGFSLYLAWFVFGSLILAGSCFMIYSRKRKGNKSFSASFGLHDEPTIIGR